jgi:hypothetical protein
MDALEAWHDYVRSRDPARLDALIADEAVFESPAVHTPQEGKAITVAYLSAALRVLGTEDFRYREEWRGERSAVLEFATVLDGLTVNGVDIIHWNDEGRITHFKVMVRPLKALNRLIEAMAAALQQGEG